jgi:hypothetical protein
MSRPVSVSDVQQELSLRGGLLPLMHLYPNETTHPGVWVARSTLIPGVLSCALAYATWLRFFVSPKVGRANLARSHCACVTGCMHPALPAKHSHRSASVTLCGLLCCVLCCGAASHPPRFQHTMAARGPEAAAVAGTQRRLPSSSSRAAHVPCDMSRQHALEYRCICVSMWVLHKRTGCLLLQAVQVSRVWLGTPVLQSAPSKPYEFAAAAATLLLSQSVCCAPQGVHKGGRVLGSQPELLRSARRACGRRTWWCAVASSPVRVAGTLHGPGIRLQIDVCIDQAVQTVQQECDSRHGQKRATEPDCNDKAARATRQFDKHHQTEMCALWSL